MMSNIKFCFLFCLLTISPSHTRSIVGALVRRSGGHLHDHKPFHCALLFLQNNKNHLRFQYTCGLICTGISGLLGIENYVFLHMRNPRWNIKDRHFSLYLDINTPLYTVTLNIFWFESWKRKIWKIWIETWLKTCQKYFLIKIYLKYIEIFSDFTILKQFFEKKENMKDTHYVWIL